MEFSSGITVITGANASGKTNIFEALFLLSTGKSFRARVEEEMIKHDEEVAKVKGVLVSDSLKGDGGNNLEVTLTRGKIKIENLSYTSEKVERKKLMINGVGRRLIDFAGTFKAVLFGPWDMELVTGPPSLRRKFLDTVLSQVDREYRRASLSYEKGLKQRNRLLLRIREERLSRSQLLFWDRLLIKNGDYISVKREEFIDFANRLQIGSPFDDFELEYDKSAISEARLEQYAQEEVAAATTLVGPHRDDIIFKAKNSNQRQRDLSRFGSRGEQRMAVLWLKLVELKYIYDKTKEKPTLLLDDIFSELDHRHRKIVFDISKVQQTIITTSDPHYLKDFGDLEVVKI